MLQTHDYNMEALALTGKSLDKFGYMMGVQRGANEPDNVYRHRIYIAHKYIYSSSPLDSMINDISNIGALVIKIETNFTWLPTSDMPRQSFRATVVGGDRHSIAQCIHDNRTLGVASVGDTSGVARDFAGGSVSERFNHIEIDYISRAIAFMEKWQPIIYDIKDAIRDDTMI